MKSKTTNLIAAFALIAALTILIYAGVSGTIRATIPFDFTVANTPMAAGKYVVARAPVNGALMIKAIDGTKSIAFITHENELARSAKKAQLTFHRYGNRYFLAEVWDGQSSLSSALVKSKAEREAAREAGRYLAQGEAQPEIVTIAVQLAQ